MKSHNKFFSFIFRHIIPLLVCSLLWQSLSYGTPLILEDKLEGKNVETLAPNSAFIQEEKPETKPAGFGKIPAFVKKSNSSSSGPVSTGLTPRQFTLRKHLFMALVVPATMAMLTPAWAMPREAINVLEQLSIHLGTQLGTDSHPGSMLAEIQSKEVAVTLNQEVITAPMAKSWAKETLADKEKSVLQRRGAILILGYLSDTSDDDVIESLESALEDDDKSIQKAAMWAAWVSGSNASKALLIRVFNKETNPATAKNLIDSLWRSRKDVSYFVQALKILSEVEGKFEISKKGIGILIQALGHREERVRNDAEKILLKIGEEAIPFLINRGLASANPERQKYAVKILAALGKPAEAKLLEVLVDYQNHENKPAILRILKNTANALNEIGGLHLIEPLNQAALQETNLAVKKRMENAIKSIYGKWLHNIPKLSTEELIKLLGDPREGIQKKVVAALITRGSEIEESITSQFRRKNWRRRLGAALVLKHIGTSKSLPALDRAYKKETSPRRKGIKNVQEAIQEARVWIWGREGNIFELIDILDNKSTVAGKEIPEVQNRHMLGKVVGVVQNKRLLGKVVDLLGETGDLRAQQALLNTRKNTLDLDSMIKEKIKEADLKIRLDNMSMQELINTVINGKALLFQPSWYRERAKKRLIAMGETAVVPLIRMLSSKRWEVRLDIVKILGEIGDNRAIGPLQHLRRVERNAMVKKPIERALLKIKRKIAERKMQEKQSSLQTILKDLLLALQNKDEEKFYRLIEEVQNKWPAEASILIVLSGKSSLPNIPQDKFKTEIDRLVTWASINTAA